MKNKILDAERLKKVIEWSELSANAFAKKIGYESGQTVYNILNYGRPISMRFALSVVNAFELISINWLLTGEGTMIDVASKNSEVFNGKSQTGNEAESKKESSCKEIPYYDIEVSAGPISFYQDYPELPHTALEIPFVSDVDLAMPVYGDSMYPRIKSGDIVLLKKITDPDIILFGEVYLVITNDYRTLKYVRKHEDDSKIILVSENEKFDPVTIRKDSILHLFIYKGKFEKSQI
ncbi:MAG: helix-turn-helix domain-containing protein [Bacteroidetes bacterium]|nr:MAG: helix-turn-helix domain-containing protein [Bacteroidota bacterium]